MDLQRIRIALTPAQRAKIGLDTAWLRYSSADGLDDESAFIQWLITQYPQVAQSLSALTVEPVQASPMSPVHIQSEVHEDARTIVQDASPADDSDAPTQSMPATDVVAEASTLLPLRSEAAVADTEEAARTIPQNSDAADAPTEQVVPAPASEPAAADWPVTGAAADFHYVILGTAGKGGMGTVHIAQDTELLRRVALKQLNPEAEGVASARTRFLREVQITAQLDHPNIVPVYALEVVPGGAPAYTMKFVEGKTFHALLNESRDFFQSKRLPDETRALPARIEHFLKVCDAMAYAHDKGVIHRDLKPANLMLGRHNEVYVMDWGLCRAVRQADEAPPDKSAVFSTPDISGSASDTQLGDIVGTPKYMSPEQAQGRNDELDARSDQCSLGLILFELVTLDPPYPGRTAYEVMVNAAAGKRRPVAHAYMKRRVAPELVAIIERATKLSPHQRYPDVGEMAADLRRYLRGEQVHARPDSLWQRAQRQLVRHRQRALTGVLALIAIAAVSIGWLLWQNQQLFKAERLREQRLLQLQNAVDDVGGRVQTRMLQLEGALQNMADSVTQINEFGRPGDTPFYLLRDFRDAAKAPTDLTANKTLGGKISLKWPVWTIPPGMSQAEALPTIRKLASLQDFRKDLYQRAALMIQHKQSDMYTARMDDVVNLSQTNPLAAIMLAMDNGIASRYPGWDALPLDYDPRQHPWYTLAAEKFGPQWGDPYRSSVTGTMELPLSIALYDHNGAYHSRRFAGVVSALLIPDLVVHALLDVDGVSGLRGVYLLDADGDIMASTGNLVEAESAAPDAAIANKFPLPAFLQRLHAGQTGIYETVLRGQQAVLASDVVMPLGWFVVAVADPAALLKDTGQHTPAY
jgi:eukaryotic-like serine/threonine-protein kinase